MKDNFRDIYEELTWCMFKTSGGNPYIIEDLVQERNKERFKGKEKI